MSQDDIDRKVETMPSLPSQVYGKKLNKSQIIKVLQPASNGTRDFMEDLNVQINNLDDGLNQYQPEGSLIPPNKQQILKILRNSNKFTPAKSHSGFKIDTRLKTCYLHVDNLYSNPDKQLPQTKLDLITMALSHKQIQKEQRRETRPIDLQKKRRIMHQIQAKITLDESNRRQREKVLQEHEMKKAVQELDVGQLTLQMITDLRQKYFSELTADDTKEKFKRIKEIKETFVPRQIEQKQQKVAESQRQLLQHDLLSRKSQFNSYYQLLALEKTMRKVVALKLKPDLKTYSRFRGAERYANYNGIGSIVHGYIHTHKNQEQSI